MRAKFINEFKRGIDPKDALNIGLFKLIKNWLKAKRLSKNNYTINKDFTINIEGKISIYSYDMPLPDFIKFRKISKDFSITGCKELKSLDILPEWVGGNLTFYGNGIKPSKEQIREICQIEGLINIYSPDYIKNKKAQDKYLAKGAIPTRKSHIYPKKAETIQGFTFTEETKYSKGYKLWKMLKAMKDTGSEGIRYVDLTKIAHDMAYGMGSYDHNRKNNRGWGSGWFKGAMPYYADKLPGKQGKWVINSSGERYLQSHSYFDDGKEF